jgi:hypothetical protein
MSVMGGIVSPKGRGARSPRPTSHHFVTARPGHGRGPHRATMEIEPEDVQAFLPSPEIRPGYGQPLSAMIDNLNFPNQDVYSIQSESRGSGIESTWLMRLFC